MGTKFFQGIVYIGREGQNPVLPQDQIAHRNSLRSQSWSFLILSLTHRRGGNTGPGLWKRKKRERRNEGLLAEAHRPWAGFPLFSGGKAQSRISCKGTYLSQAWATYKNIAPSHKPQSQGCSVRFTVCFHFTQPGLLEDTFVPRGLISEGCRRVATWKLTRIRICKLHPKTMDTCNSYVRIGPSGKFQ